jgi:hypothetical protein
MAKKENYSIFNRHHEENYSIREATHQEKKHLVVPVTMMVEGVHHGNHGPLLHLMTELGKFPEAWNGIPIVVDHPEVEGQSVSANSPDIIDARTVGRVYNTHVDGSRLRSEAWIDENKLRQVSSDTLAQLLALEMIEVSVGVFNEEEVVTGDWNGEQYSAIARNHRPDHLALLPGGTGACSVADGCGIRANNKKGGKNVMSKEDLIKALKTLKDSGSAILEIVDNTTEGIMERLNAVRSKIDSMDTQDVIHFLKEVYDDFVVYESRMRVGGAKMFKQGYSFNSGVVELTGNPIEVHQKVEYLPIESNSFIRTKFKNKEVNSMETNKCSKCVEKINALIANSASGFVESDREWLDTLSEAALDKIVPKEVKKETKEKETVVVNNMSEEDKADIAWARAQRKQKRATLIKGIQANTSKEMWPDAVLETMEESVLEKLAATSKKEEEVDYSLQNNEEFQTNGEEVEPMPLGGTEFETAKK